MEIKVPSNSTFKLSPNVHGHIKWSGALKKRLSDKYGEGGDLQEKIDYAVLNGCKKYIPFDRGALEKSGVKSTTVGRGKVKWCTPYARYLYYGKLMVDPVTKSAYARKGVKKELTNKDLKYGQDRGSKWFETWKQKHLDELIKELSKEI